MDRIKQLADEIQAEMLARTGMSSAQFERSFGWSRTTDDMLKEVERVEAGRALIKDIGDGEYFRVAKYGTPYRLNRLEIELDSHTIMEYVGVNCDTYKARAFESTDAVYPGR